jgi:hypothetical protein
MISHLVTMRLRRGLSAADLEKLVESFERAIREIPSVRNVRLGRRVIHGATYEQRMPNAADFLVMIDFEDFAGLIAYLRHPAHLDLGVRFNGSLAAGLIFDFEEVRLADLREAMTSMP